MSRNLIWLGDSRKRLKRFPDDVRQDIGFALRRVQEGESPPQQKKLKGKDLAGVYEIVEDGQGGTYRAVYVVTLGEAIYVLHTFHKKSKRGIATPKPDMDLIRERLQAAKELASEQE